MITLKRSFIVQSQKLVIAYTRQQDEKKERLTISVWMRQRWENQLLRWDPKRYNGIRSISINPKRVWKPDIVLYESVEEDISFGGNLDSLNTRIIMFYHGMHHWHAQAVLKSGCRINVTSVTSGEQECTLTFGCWSYDGFRVHVKEESNTVYLGSVSFNT